MKLAGEHSTKEVLVKCPDTLEYLSITISITVSIS